MAGETAALEDGTHLVDEDARAGRESLVGEGYDRGFFRVLGHYRPGRVNANPLDEPLDLLRGERIFIARHLLAIDLVAHRLDQQAPRGISGDDRGTGVAAPQHRIPGVEPQTPPAQPSVTFEAAPGQHGTHPGLEELLWGLRGGRPDEEHRGSQKERQHETQV